MKLNNSFKAFKNNVSVFCFYKFIGMVCAILNNFKQFAVPASTQSFLI